MRKQTAFLVTALNMLFACTLMASPASAQPTSYALTSDKSTIKESGEDHTVDFTLINLTDKAAKVTLSTSEGGDHCTAKPSGRLTARQQETITFTLEDCEVEAGDTLGFTLGVGRDSFEVTAELKDEPDPDWELLWMFLVALVGGALLVAVGWVSFLSKPPTDLVNLNDVKPSTPLPHLGANWSFKDSWAANVTLVSAVFTGLFGTSDLLKSAFGEEAPSALAVITIASGIGVALVGVAPLLLQAARNDKAEVLAGGLFGSAAMAVGASGGLTLIVVLSVTPNVEGVAEKALWTGASLALALLAVYAVASVRQNLIKGLTEPPTPPPANEEQIAAIVAAWKELLGDQVTEDQLREHVQQLEDVYPRSYPPYGTSPGDDRPAALI